MRLSLLAGEPIDVDDDQVWDLLADIQKVEGAIDVGNDKLCD